MQNLLGDQLEEDIEVVIVNPNSPDADDAVAQKWAAQDDRVNYIFVPEREPYGTSWIRAWEAAKGDIVINANTDDRNFPPAAGLYHEAITTRIDEGVAFTYGGIAVLDEKTNRYTTGGIKPEFSRAKMSYECWAGPSVGWRNDVAFREAVDWDLMKRKSLEHSSAFDYWLWLYFMSLGHSGYSIQEILVEYMQRDDSIENSNRAKNNYETFASIAEFFPENFDTHLKPAAEFQTWPDLPDKNQWIKDRS
jgi:glycosyltransferase involved in cell wall biosynthesis